MKFLTKLTALVLCLIIVSGLSVSAGAATLDATKTNAKASASLLAADFKIDAVSVESDIELPAYYSSRDLGYTTAVRRQLYNTCWAYGATATLESTALKDGYTIDHLSPTHLNHLSTKHEDGTGWNRDYLAGGYSYITLGYLSSWQGPIADKDYPETVNFNDFSTVNQNLKPQFAVNGIMYLDSGNNDEIKQAIYKYGAVAANYHVDDSCYNNNTYAYYCNTPDLTVDQLYGHCISIVGWDDNFKKENFVEGKQPLADGAFLCKNSWGSYWGDGGYFWISYEDYYLFDKKFGHNYAFCDYSAYDSTKKLYQNELDGATYEFDYLTPYDKMTYINVFDTDEEYNLIEKINFESTSVGAEYTIFMIPLTAENTPTEETEKWVEIGKGTVPYQGYHSIDTTDQLITDDKFAIGITLSKANNSSNTIGVCEWLSVNVEGQEEPNYVYTPQVQRGESFAYVNSMYLMLDAVDLYSKYLNDDIGGTFVIKAIGAAEPYEIGDANMDYSLSIFDVTLIQRALAMYLTLSDQQKYLADFDQDGVVSILDATRIQYKLAGIEI